jgi:hypothetical protein
MIVMEKHNVYPIDKEIYKVEELKIQSNNSINIQNNEEANLFEYEKANSAYTGVYENQNY